MTTEIGDHNQCAQNSTDAVGQETFRRGAALAKALDRYLEKRRTRYALSELTDEQLKDIGLIPSEARAEVSKSWFWR